MSNPCLPPEPLDHIADLLHDARPELRNCCLVSKSWIPRTRKHLFASIEFCYDTDLGSWKKAFPNPKTSPGRYTTTLGIGCSNVITAADAEAGGWTRGFSRLVYLEVGGTPLCPNESKISFVPLHGLSPVVKSLRMNFTKPPPPSVLDLALSFPLLEDLAVSTLFGAPNDGNLPTIVQPSNAPPFTGSLELSRGDVKPIARPLLSLPGGIHFRKLTLRQLHEDILSLILGLVEGCSHTLKSLDLASHQDGTSVWYLCPCQWFTFVSSRARDTFDRPLGSDKTRRSGFLAGIAEHQ